MPLLADVNVATQVVAHLRAQGVDGASIFERGLARIVREDDVGPHAMLVVGAAGAGPSLQSLTLPVEER